MNTRKLTNYIDLTPDTLFTPDTLDKPGTLYTADTSYSPDTLYTLDTDTHHIYKPGTLFQRHTV